MSNITINDQQALSEYLTSPNRLPIRDSIDNNDLITVQSSDGSLSTVYVGTITSSSGGLINNIGVPGDIGFGIGICPSIPPGFSEMEGTTIKGHDNYGNYTYLDGSVMCWIPAFYYRLGNPLDTAYNLYGVNGVSIKPLSNFTSVSEANIDGYALHRAFIDGGIQHQGFFFDKYQWSYGSLGADTVASSIKNGNPLSSNASHNPFSGLTGLTTGDNIHAGAIKAAKTRGTLFHCASRFQYSALALLSLAHGQLSTNINNCAWFLLNKNYPKGCNNGAIKDNDDTVATWQSDGYSNCGKTGSCGYGGGVGNVFSKSTHNGQNSGVADLNGNMWEVSLGVTCVGTSKSISGVSLSNPCSLTITGHGRANGDIVMITSIVGTTQLNGKVYNVTVVNPNTITLNNINATDYTTYISGGTASFGSFYVVKESTSMISFTSGLTLNTDHWGSSGISNMMEPLNPTFLFGGGGECRYGNTTNQVFSSSVSGSNYINTSLGIPQSLGISSSGTSVFGVDYFYQHVRDQLCLVSGGNWSYGSTAGVWTVGWSSARSDSGGDVGGRSGLYYVV